MASPLGDGEKRHPHTGNTILTTYTRKGDKVETPLWISQFATDLNLQLDIAQGRAGLIHRPIRLTERFLVFSTLWNVADREKYVKLIDRLREHWVYNLNDNRSISPMKLKYFGANKTWLGNIEAASIGYAVTDVILTYTFNMRLVPSVSEKHSNVKGIASPYSPTSADAEKFGTQWFTLGELVALGIGTAQEDKNGARDGHRDDPITGGDGGKKR